MTSENNKNKTSNLQKALTVLIVFIVLIFVFFMFAMLLSIYYNKWKSITWFLNGDQKFTFRIFILGIISAMVFGFVDNAGMFFGLDALKPYLPGGPLVRAGWGNTISSVMGSFLSSSVSKMIQITTGFQNGPIYADAMGMFIGGLLGTYIPSLITGKE